MSTSLGRVYLSSITELTSSVTSAEAETPALPGETLYLSATRTKAKRLDWSEWRTLRAEIIARYNQTCTSCTYTSSHPTGKDLKIDHWNGDPSDNDPANLRVRCPPCKAIRNCWFSGMMKWVQLASSDLEQVEIVRRTREIFEQCGRIPQIEEVDPLAKIVEMQTMDLAKTLRATDWEDLTGVEKGLRGFFTPEAKNLFEIAVTAKSDNPTRWQALNPSDAEALKVLEVENTMIPRIRFSRESHSTLHEFLTKWVPSKTARSEVTWICIDNARLKPEYDESMDQTRVTEVCEAWKKVCRDREPVIADLDELAREFDVLVGKWLVFSPASQVDSLWPQIARATYAGTLGISAKVSPRESGLNHLICIYNRDYTNKHEVDNVRNGLRRLGVRWPLRYKPNVYTYCNVYSDNPWNISPSRYQD